MQSDVLTLVAARPGRVRDSLQVLLTTLPQIETIALVGDETSTVKMLTSYQPTLVLLDTNLPGAGAVWTVLQHIKALYPQTHCLILTDNVRQRQAAQAAGADGVLIKGFSTEELFATIESLLSGNMIDNGKKGNDDKSTVHLS